MSLFFALTLLIGGIVAGGIAYWGDTEFRGVGFMAGIFALALLGPLGCIGYGAITWLRVGKWGTITILDVLHYLLRIGVDVQFFLQPVSWRWGTGP